MLGVRKRFRPLLTKLHLRLQPLLARVLKPLANQQAADSDDLARLEHVLNIDPPKTILVLGAAGFIGRHLIPALRHDGHRIVAGLRAGGVRPFELEQLGQEIRYLEIDFQQAVNPQQWLAALHGVDVVINTVGIFEETASQCFDLLHAQAPAALFKACEETGVELLIHLSALGADAAASSAYHLSKKAGDDALRELDSPGFILQPSLIYGAEGLSSQWFSWLASLPFVMLPAGGRQMLQPIHVDDVVALIARLVRQVPPGVVTLPVVGAKALSLRAYLQSLRQQMGLGKLWVLSLPMGMARWIAGLAQRWPQQMLTRESLAMLERGSTAEVKDMQALLGRIPKPVQQFISPQDGVFVRQRALLGWGLSLLRFSLVIVWIGTGVVSLAVYPHAQSYELLGQLGLHGDVALVAFYGAACLDIALGFAIWICRKRQWVWRLQISVILIYTLCLSLALPEFWQHPFGPLLKNIPILALTYFLLQMESNDGLPRR